MGFFSKKDKQSTRTHRIVTGLIVGGAVGSVLGIYAARSRRKARHNGEEEPINLDIPIQEQAGSHESVERVVVKTATQPICKCCKGAFMVLRGIFRVIKYIFQILARRGQRQGRGIDDL
ncbi:MAG: hypothetical protein NTZ80_01195 [Patescibacteria group bacterium]|nr:hypothetical protein [Patescibacteria group bacterium]